MNLIFRTLSFDKFWSNLTVSFLHDYIMNNNSYDLSTDDVKNTNPRWCSTSLSKKFDDRKLAEHTVAKFLRHPVKCNILSYKMIKSYIRERSQHIVTLVS